MRCFILMVVLSVSMLYAQDSLSISKDSIQAAKYYIQLNELKAQHTYKGAIELLGGLTCLAVSYIEPSVRYSKEMKLYDKSVQNIPSRYRESYLDSIKAPKWGEDKWGYILIGTVSGLALTLVGIADLNVGVDYEKKGIEITKTIPIKEYKPEPELTKKQKATISVVGVIGVIAFITTGIIVISSATHTE